MNSKWQRINHMPPLPLYPGEPRVTAGATHIALAREAAAEGMVLLKNEERTLPLDPAAPLAVFGKAQADYVKGGGAVFRLKDFVALAGKIDFKGVPDVPVVVADKHIIHIFHL